MNSDLGSGRRLARGLLRLYSLAVASEHRGVADHLLCALSITASAMAVSSGVWDTKNSR
jgi:hypothetical protein